jgi:acyl dehydratase
MGEIHAREGHFFEDFAVGDVHRHQLGRTVTESDNRWFTLLTMNTNQLHFNADYAGASQHGRELVNSALTVAIVVGLSVADISQNAIANLGWTDIEIPHSVFVGDTIYAESVITGLRESRTRPHAGIVSVFTRGLNQDGTVVMTFKRTVMVHRRSNRTAAIRFPEPASPILEALA